MCFRIAAGNIKRSYKDYTIYFLTLILAVCIFYSFNSIGSQKALIEIKSSDAKYILRLIDAMSFLSIFASIILGSLILYANNFLVRKRKKELAIYMILGMEKYKISKILIGETFMVGAVSLIFGLIFGIAASQALSIFTLKLFNVEMSRYEFTVSISAVGKTVLYFGIMFLTIAIFNVFVISKYKIIDLLTSGRKNENMKFRNPLAHLFIFISSVILLAITYKYILDVGLDTRNSIFKLSLVLAVLCTAAFFFSLAGFMMYIVKKSKKIYFKGLNIFVVKQIYMKINTNFLSMTLICLMLFAAIVILSTGIGIKKNYETEVKKMTPFDASVILYTYGKDKNIEDTLKKINFKLSKDEKCAVYHEYSQGIELGDLFKTEDKNFKGYIGLFIKISDYNKMLKLKGKGEINLNEDEVLILSNYNEFVKSINKRLKISNKVSIGGKEYTVKNHNVIEDNLHTYLVADNFCTIVINDDFLSNYKVSQSVLNVMYSDKNRKENDDKYNKLNDDCINGRYGKLSDSMRSYSKDHIYSANRGSSTTILFIAIYLGLVFLITSMTVLSLKQLSEASDSIERYRALLRIGANRKIIDRAIFTQMSIYFSVPMILALIHAAVGIKVINEYINVFGRINIASSSLVTALIFIVIYFIYFYTTYAGYKNIVRRDINL